MLKLHQHKTSKALYHIAQWKCFENTTTFMYSEDNTKSSLFLAFNPVPAIFNSRMTDLEIFKHTYQRSTNSDIEV